MPRRSSIGRRRWTIRSCETELRLVLTAAMNELPEDYRIAVVLHDIEGFSTAEVAQMWGLSVANAKTRVHRARLFLGQRLDASLTTPLVSSST
jgi:RNA polymerase sigma-70 factor (ECF subfamily)